MEVTFQQSLNRNSTNPHTTLTFLAEIMASQPKLGLEFHVQCKTGHPPCVPSTNANNTASTQPTSLSESLLAFLKESPASFERRLRPTAEDNATVAMVIKKVVSWLCELKPCKIVKGGLCLLNPIFLTCVIKVLTERAPTLLEGRKLTSLSSCQTLCPLKSTLPRQKHR